MYFTLTATRSTLSSASWPTTTHGFVHVKDLTNGFGVARWKIPNPGNSAIRLVFIGGRRVRRQLTAESTESTRSQLPRAVVQLLYQWCGTEWSAISTALCEDLVPQTWRPLGELVVTVLSTVINEQHLVSISMNGVFQQDEDHKDAISGRRSVLARPHWRRSRQKVDGDFLSTSTPLWPRLNQSAVLSV